MKYRAFVSHRPAVTILREEYIAEQFVADSVYLLPVLAPIRRKHHDTISATTGPQITRIIWRYCASYTDAHLGVKKMKLNERKLSKTFLPVSCRHQSCAVFR